MPYTAEKPPIAESSEELRRRIPGWGVDLDPADRPSVPREQLDPSLSGEASSRRPPQQPERWPRERSVEHTELPPVFGTSCPPKGLSGRLRRLAYARWSEGQSAHWLVLVGADRVDVLESALRSLLSTRPDNPITQTGLRAEVTHHGIRSRLGHGRADLEHQWMDPFVVGAPWLLALVGVFRLVRRARAARS